MARTNEEIAREWLDHAATDLAAAEQLAGDDRFVRQVLYQCVQAAEKALKSRVAASGETPRRYGHDLIKLVDRCIQLHPDLASLRGDAERLTDYGVDPRYPENPEEYIPQDAADALAAARRILEAVRQL